MIAHPNPFWFRRHHCPFLCQLKLYECSCSRHAPKSVWIMSCGAVRVLENMSINQSFFSGVSVLYMLLFPLPAVVWSVLWDLLLCEEPAVRSLTFAPCFHLFFWGGFLPLWHKHMTTELDYIGSCVSGISNSSPQLFPSLYRGVSSCWCSEVKAMIVMLRYVCVCVLLNQIHCHWQTFVLQYQSITMVLDSKVKPYSNHLEDFITEMHIFIRSSLEI